VRIRSRLESLKRGIVRIVRSVAEVEWVDIDVTVTTVPVE